MHESSGVAGRRAPGSPYRPSVCFVRCYKHCTTYGQVSPMKKHQGCTALVSIDLKLMVALAIVITTVGMALSQR